MPVVHRVSDLRSVSPRLENQRMFEVHKAIIQKLDQDPQIVIAKGLAGCRLLASRSPSPMALKWIGLWQQALTAGPAAVTHLALRDDDLGHDLRQMSPFFGVLSDQERVQALGSVARYAAE